MATNNEFITDALRLLGVLGEGQSPSANQSSDALVVFNDMMASLSADSINIGYAPQSDPTADNGRGIEVRKAVKYLLAVDLAPHYQRALDVAIVAQAMNARNQLLRESMNLALEPADMSHLPAGSANYAFRDITLL